jgi:hypothetical protein
MKRARQERRQCEAQNKHLDNTKEPSIIIAPGAQAAGGRRQAAVETKERKADGRRVERET